MKSKTNDIIDDEPAETEQQRLRLLEEAEGLRPPPPAIVAEIVGKAWAELANHNDVIRINPLHHEFVTAVTRACEEYGVTLHQKLIVEAVETRVELQQLRQQLEWTQKALDMAGAGGMTELVAKLQSAEADTKRLERVAELEATIVFQDDQWEVYGLPSNHCIGRGKTLRAAIDAATEMNENTTR